MAKQPRLITLRLSDIGFDINASSCKLQSKLRYISQSIPTVTRQALEVLTLAQPLLVTQNEKNDKRHYRLIAGYRTFQLLLEQMPRSQKVWAILLPLQSEASEAKITAFDAVVSKLLLRPDGKDLAVIAATLHDDERLRQDASSFINVGTDNELALALGMSRTTLHRQIQTAKTALSQFVEHSDTSKKVDVETPPDEDDE